MIKLKQGVFGSAILLGSMVLAGCGTSGHPVAIAPGHHSQVVSKSTPASPSISSTTPSSNNVSSSTTSSGASSPSISSSSSPTSRTTSPVENTLQYTSQQKSFITRAAQAAGLPSATVPTHGFGSQYQNTQRSLASGGGYMLVINYNNFGIQEFTRPMLTGRAILKTVPLTILGSSVTGTWNQPPSRSGALPLLTFHTNGMYYLIGGSRDLSQNQIDTIAESLTKL